MGIKDTCKQCLEWRTLWMAILVPVALLPLPILYQDDAARCGYCVLVIGFYWVSEVIPLAATSLLPIVLFPLFGIMSAKETCSSYAKDTLMLFMGSLVVAVAVERWDLHRRMALRTLTLVGPEPKWLMFGIMMPCWFLSMWMSNTATAAMMMPIVNAILEQIKLTRQQSDAEDGSIIMKTRSSSDSDPDLAAPDSVKIIDSKEPAELAENGRLHVDRKRKPVDTEFMRLAKTFSLCTAFAANVGGMATLTGTPPNVIFKGQADRMFKKAGDSGVNFANWLLVGIPISIIIFVFVWGWLYLYTVRSKILRCCKKDRESYEGVRNIIHKEASKLGTMTFPEVIVLINFIILALLWVTRKPGFIPGWSSLLKPNFSGDSTPAVMIGVILFILPAKMPACFRSADIPKDPNEPEGYVPILNWKVVNERMAWGVLLLMGGGFALADACQRSGLSAWVSAHLMTLGFLEPWLLGLLLAVVISLATQVTSNAATATLFLPIVGELAIDLGLHPLYFMIPCTLATSLAFLLPVATPPNAIVFASGYLEVKDMMIAGSAINVFSLVVVTIAMNTWVIPFYQLDTLPAIFAGNTSTVLPPSVSPVAVINLTIPH